MPHDLTLILTLTGGLSAALVFGYLTQWVRLSPIVGYLLAGILVGPFTPGFVAHQGLAQQLAEIGVILLMFGVGLEFHVDELLAVRRIAVPGAVVQIVAATALGLVVTHFAGWSLASGIVFGLAISVASTVVLLRMLADRNALHTASGHIAVGWLVVEDVFTVIVLVLLPELFEAGELRGGMPALLALGTALLKVLGLIAFTMVVGRRLIPKLLERVALLRSRELFTLAVLVVALGISVGSALAFGVSMALGAFLAGMVVAQSEFSSRAAADALPMRDAFAVLFFVSMGMLFDPAQLMANLPLTLGTIAVVVVGKPLAAALVVLALKRPLRSALVVSAALAQIGEFSFILASLGRSLEVLPEAASQVLVVASIASITINPFLFRLIDPLLAHLGSRSHRDGEAEVATQGSPHSIVIGHGPIGMLVARLLRENGVPPVVIELNHETVQKLRAEGHRAIYGDATQRAILEQAGTERARSLVFTPSGTSAEAVIRLAKELNPSLLVLARATYLREVEALRGAGAGAVVTAEAEVALAMTERVLRELGATPDQLDRERARARETLHLPKEEVRADAPATSDLGLRVAEREP